MIDSFVDIRVRISNFRELARRVAALPERFRPTYFTVGERVRNKDTSRVDDAERFSTFVDQHVDRVSGFDLIGDRIRFGFFVGETRNAQHESTHVGCSVVLRGRQWRPADYTDLLKRLCLACGVERAEACRRAEWNFRHVCMKKLPRFAIEETLGVDMSAFFPGLYWWTVFSDELAARHRLDVGELAAFAGHSERWFTESGGGLHAFRLYDSPDDWEREKTRVTAFLEAHPNFFSMTRVAELINQAEIKEELDEVARPYWAGATSWESIPRHLAGTST